MRLIGESLRRVWYLLNRDRLEGALRAEMEAHRAMMGEPARFGNTLRLREASHEVWGWAWLDAIVRDVRFAARGLRRTPVFTVVAVLSLALGLALTIVTLSVLNAYLLRSLPYPGASRLYHVMYAPPGPWEPAGMTALDWSSVADVVEHPVAVSSATFYYGEGGITQSLTAALATPGFMDGLRVSVPTGRTFAPGDYTAGAEPVALISQALWRERFGGDPAAIGRLIRGESESRPGVAETFRIVGVLPPGFYFGRDSRARIDLLIPNPGPTRAYMVRLREGVPVNVAEQRITEAARRAATSTIPAEWTGVHLESAHERYVGRLRPVLVGVTVAVGLLLVIVSANIAVLLLLRAMQRQKEVAVRLALGSGRRHIARMLLTETFLVCAAALAAALAVTSILLASLAPLIEMQLGRPAPNAAGIAIDTTVLLIVGTVSVLLALSISLAPLVSWGRPLVDWLRQDARVASDGVWMQRLRRSLIALEVAGAVVLLVGCGVMIRSVVRMLQTDLGFEAGGLVTSRVMLRARNYPDPEAYRRFYERFVDRLGTASGSAVVFSTWPPFVFAPSVLVEADAAAAPVSAGGIGVSAGYFSTFSIRLRQGREFSGAEASANAAVAVISETLARRLWPDGSALGQRVRAIEPTPQGPTAGPWRTVIGVAADVRQGYDDENRGDLYTPRMPDGRFGTFYMRSSRPPALLADQVKSAAADVDREAVLNEPRQVAGDDRQLAGTRFMTVLLTGLAAVAAFLATVGIYGVTAYAVQQRTKEVAIRVALGASQHAVLAVFLREGALMLLAGALSGIVGGAWLARVLRNQVFGVQAFDVWTCAGACLLLLTAGVAAVWWPVRRASLGPPSAVLNGN